jgi:hypothetical protein
MSDEELKAKLAKAVDALAFYRDGFAKKAKVGLAGTILSVDYVPTRALLDDMGNRAIDTLAEIEGEQP